MFVLENTRKVELLRATLTALAAYLSWIPPGNQQLTRLLLSLVCYIAEFAMVPAARQLHCVGGPVAV